MIRETKSKDNERENLENKSENSRDNKKNIKVMMVVS